MTFPQHPLRMAARGAITPRTLIYLPLSGEQPPGEATASNAENKFTLVYLQGFIQTESGIAHYNPGEFGEGDLGDPTIEQVSLAMGAFIAVFRNRATGEYRAFTDFYGFAKLFYAEVNGALILSDSLIAVSQILSANNLSLSFSDPYICGVFGSFNALLNHHPFSSATLIEDVAYLSSDKEVRVFRDSSWRTVPRGHFQDDRGRTFDQLMDAGIDRAVDFCRSLADIDVPDKVLYLSGGRDSRNVLAFLLGANAEKEFSVFAKEPPQGQTAFTQKLDIDRAISAELARHYSLNIWNETGSVKLTNKYHDTRWYLNYRGGFHHDYSAPRVGSVHPSVRLIGAMGECYRTKVPDFLSGMPSLDLGMTVESFEDDFQKFYGAMLPKASIDNEDAYFSNMQDFETSLHSENESLALWEALDRFSEVYRMSNHFDPALEQSVNIWNMNVLAIPEFTYAANTLEREERTSGVVWREVHRRIDPKLNDFDFEGMYEDYDDFPSSRIKAGKQYWGKAMNSRPEWVSAHSQQVDPKSGLMVAENAYTYSKQLLERHSDLIGNAIGKRRLLHIMARVDARSIMINRLLGKLVALDHLRDPSFRLAVTEITL